MTLDESVEGLERLDSNNITAYIDGQLHENLSKMGDIYVDFITNPTGQSGYMVTIGRPGQGCEGCSCG
jgi:hypothetical protein